MRDLKLSLNKGKIPFKESNSLPRDSGVLAHVLLCVLPHAFTAAVVAEFLPFPQLVQFRHFGNLILFSNFGRF